ncbi:MAG: S16 family serine protease [Thermomicrobiales bacterium]
MARPFAYFSMFLLVFTAVATACGPVGGDDDDPTQTPVIITATPSGGGDGEATATEASSEPTATPLTADATPTPSADVPTPEPSPTTAPQPIGATVEADALWAGYDGQQGIGGTSHVRVTVENNDVGDLRVGFFESEVGGSGAQWRSSGWMAVITASLMLGINPSEYEFAFDIAGRADGPSAGALMTVAVLAGLLGDQIDPTMTMTGTINPDGTIGPVGGIPHKIVGAAEAGKTTVLVPAGQRFDVDYTLQQPVDLVQVGNQNGVEVVLVPDVYTAYRMLTGGSEIPVLDSVGTASMPPDAYNKYRAGATDWYARYQEERNRFLELPVEVQEYRTDIILFADDLATQADALLIEGQVSRAFQLMWEAAVFVKVGTQAAELDNLYLTQGIDPMISRVDSSASSQTRLSALVQKLEAQTPRTATDTVALIDAAAYLSAAQGIIFQANQAIDDLQYTEYTEDDILTAIYSSAYSFALADFYIEVADDIMSIGVGFGTTPAPDLDTLTAMSEVFRRGAESNIGYFDSVIIAPFAEQNGYSLELGKLLFIDADDTYLTAIAAVNGADILIGSMTKPEAQEIMRLGASLLGFNQSAMLIAEYYSLDARVDEFGSVVEYGRQTALAEMLDLADQRAEVWLSSVADEDPVSPLYYYDNARLERQGDAFEQLDSLGDFWHSAVLSELLAIFRISSSPS